MKKYIYLCIFFVIAAFLDLWVGSYFIDKIPTGSWVLLPAITTIFVFGMSSILGLIFYAAKISAVD